MKEQRFWMVLGAGPPTCRHGTKAAAAREAERLASQHRGQRFYVLEALACVQTTDVAWQTLDDLNGSGEEIPF